MPLKNAVISPFPVPMNNIFVNLQQNTNSYANIIMIVVRLNGGLGNQLFQYATGRHVAHLNKTELYIDTSAFSDNTVDSKWKYELPAFHINATLANEELLKHFKLNDFSTSGIMLTKLLSFGKYGKYKFNEYGFDSNVLELRGNYYLKGFFQSEKFFKNIAESLKEELVIKENFLPQKTDLLQDISNKNSVSIHIRRGDYIRNLSAMDTHGLCSKDYYTKAIEFIKRELGNDLHFYLFTDDEEWIHREMHWDIDCTLLSGNSTIEDFYLMSQCKHNIIANSTFSWWAAWLNKNPNKKIIIPKHWRTNVKTEDIYLNPPKWFIK